MHQPVAEHHLQPSYLLLPATQSRAAIHLQLLWVSVPVLGCQGPDPRFLLGMGQLAACPWAVNHLAGLLQVPHLCPVLQHPVV